MPIRVECYCGSVYGVHNKYRGKKIRCPKCGDVVVVPGSPQINRKRRVVQNHSERVELQYDAPVRRSPKRKRNGRKSNGKRTAIAIGSCILATSLLAIITLAVVKKSNPFGNPFGSTAEPISGTSWSDRSWNMAETDSMLLGQNNLIGYHRKFIISRVRGYYDPSITGFEKTIIIWSGNIRKDGTGPSVKLAFSDNSRFEKNANATAILKSILADRQKKQKSFRHGEIETGKLDKMRFARAYWTATDEVSNPSVKHTGVEYCTIDDSYVVRFSVEDSAEHAEKTLPAAEAMVQSFRKYEPPKNNEKLKPKDRWSSSYSVGPGSKYDNLLNSRITEFGGKSIELTLPSLESLPSRIAIPKNPTDLNNRRARLRHSYANIVFSEGSEPYVAVANLVYNPRNGRVVGRIPELNPFNYGRRALSRNGNILAQAMKSRSHDFEVQLFSSVSGTKQKSLVYDHVESAGFRRKDWNGNKLSLQELKFLNNEELLAVFENLSVLWNLKTGKAKMLGIKQDSSDDGCAVGENGKILAVANDGAIGVYDISSGLAIASMENIPGENSLTSCSGLAFSFKSDELAALGLRHFVVWNKKGKIVFLKPIKEYRLREMDKGRNVQWLSDGSGWILAGKYFLDRKTKTVLWEAKPWHTFSDEKHRVVGNGFLTTICRDVTGTRGELITIPIPKRDIAKARRSIAGKTPVPMSRLKRNRLGIVPILISDFTKW